jgi:hypothetical protein
MAPVIEEEFSVNTDLVLGEKPRDSSSLLVERTVTSFRVTAIGKFLLPLSAHWSRPHFSVHADEGGENKISKSMAAVG